MSIGPWTFTGFDIVVLLVLLVSMIMAASRGFFREIISIVALLVAIIAGLFVWGRFRFAAQDLIQPGWLADIALGAGTFALAYLLAVFLMSGLTKPLRGKEVGFLDRLAGAGFGIARGLLIGGLFVMLMTADYREAKEMENFTETMTAEQRAALESAPKSVRDMMKIGKQAELPGMFKDSTFYPLLDKIGAGIRVLPFAKFKTMAEKLKDGEDITQIIDEADL